MRHIFIINPELGNISTAESIRAQLKERAKREHFDYLVFNTEYSGHETKLAAQMEDLFSDEELRFYCCGGMGTFNNMLQGIKDFKKNQVAFYPCGISSDILKVFGRGRRYFTSLDNLIDGVVTPMDLIRTDNFVAVNNIICGGGTRLVKKLDFLKNNFRMIMPFNYTFFGMLNTLFGRGNAYNINIDGVKYSGNYKMVLIGNGSFLSARFSPLAWANVYDGILDFYMMKVCSTKDVLSANRNYHKYNNPDAVKLIGIVTTGIEFEICSRDNRPIMIARDGEIQEVNSLKGHIEPGALNFVIPSKLFAEMNHE